MTPPNDFRTPGAGLNRGRIPNIILLCFLDFLLPAFVVLRLKRPRVPHPLQGTS